MKHFVVAVAALVASSIAYAGEPVTVPEPGILELLAMAGVVGAIVAIRKRRK